MIFFRNLETFETLEHVEFVALVWKEAEQLYNEEHDGGWCNLTKEEQLACYCEQFEKKLLEECWTMTEL